MAVIANLEDPFTLNYNSLTDVCLVRRGTSTEPIPENLIRCENYKTFRARRMNNYREGNAKARRKNLKRVDFLLDDKNQILIQESSGNNKFLLNLCLSLAIRFWEKFFCGRHSI